MASSISFLNYIIRILTATSWFFWWVECHRQPGSAGHKKSLQQERCWLVVCGPALLGRVVTQVTPGTIAETVLEMRMWHWGATKEVCPPPGGVYQQQARHLVNCQPRSWGHKRVHHHSRWLHIPRGSSSLVIGWLRTPHGGSCQLFPSVRSALLPQEGNKVGTSHPKIKTTSIRFPWQSSGEWDINGGHMCNFWRESMTFFYSYSFLLVGMPIKWQEPQELFWTMKWTWGWKPPVAEQKDGRHPGLWHRRASFQLWTAWL